MSPRDTDQTRDKLLNAAFCEIHRNGFQAASIANILKDTGLTKGALYHHFATKQELGLAVVDEVVKGRLEALFLSRLRESVTPVQTLLQAIDGIAHGRGIEEIKLGCPLNNLMQEMSPLDERFKERLNAILADWGDIVEDALRRDQTAGVLRPDVDCQAAAWFIVSAWEGCIGIAKNLQSPEGFRSCMTQLHRYVEGLLPAADT